MNIFRKTILTAIIIIISISSLFSQTKFTREEYVDKYKYIATAHMEHYGIPASIIMAQGILESGSGNSLLSRSSNNHFGIKCKSNWKGRSVRYDDDEAQECFRAYDTVEESYRDHADFLNTQPRYDSLFSHSSSDYKRWAHGLKAAGYATAPDYAQRLIKIIEDNKLYLLDRDNGGDLYANRANIKGSKKVKYDNHFVDGSTISNTTASSEIDPDNYRVTINAHRGYNIYVANGINYILAKESDTFEKISKIFSISPRNLRKFNDLGKTAQPLNKEVIYIEKKRRKWNGSSDLHIARKGETSFAIGQKYGISTRAVERLNKLKKKDIIMEGDKIRIK